MLKITKKMHALLVILAIYSMSFAETISNKSSPALKFAAAIETSHENEQAKKEQFIACHQQHNIYCTGFLGDIYYKQKQYTLALPLIQHFLQASPPEPGTLYSWIYFDLGVMNSEGLGVKINKEKGLSYFKKSARLYEAQAAVKVFTYYYNKSGDRFYATQNYSDEIMVKDLQQAYAWLKLAYRINKVYHELPGDRIQSKTGSVPILELLEEMKGNLAKGSPQAVAQAEKMAKAL